MTLPYDGYELHLVDLSMTVHRWGFIEDEYTMVNAEGSVEVISTIIDQGWSAEMKVRYKILPPPAVWLGHKWV